MTDILKNISISFDTESIERLIMSDEEYFGDGMRSYISNSRLTLINPDQDGSPMKYDKGFKDSASNGAFDLGSAVHKLFLEKDDYTVAQIEKPAGKVGAIIEDVFKLTTRESNPLELREAVEISCKTHDYYTTNLTEVRIKGVIEKGAAYLDYLNNYQIPGALTLTADHKAKASACLASLKSHDAIVDLIYPASSVWTIKSFNEDVITIKGVATLTLDKFQTLNTIIAFKAKLDNWTIDFDNQVITLNDLKTTGSSVESFGGKTFKSIEQIGPYEIIDKLVIMEGSFQKYRYYRQMAMYSFILFQHCKQEFNVDETWTMKANMVVVETLGQHKCKVFKVSKKWLDYGMIEFLDLSKRVAYHQLYGFDKYISEELFVEL